MHTNTHPHTDTHKHTLTPHTGVWWCALGGARETCCSQSGVCICKTGMQVCVFAKRAVPNQVCVFASLYRKRAVPNQVCVFASLYGKRVVPNQVCVFASLYGKRAVPNQVCVFASLYGKRAVPNQVCVFASLCMYSHMLHVRVWRIPLFQMWAHHTRCSKLIVRVQVHFFMRIHFMSAEAFYSTIS